MAESKFTAEVIARLAKVADENNGLDWEIAQELAEEIGVPPRAIVASAKRNQIAYRRKEKVAKSGKAIISKAALITKIAEKYDIDVEALDGLDKATKSSLEAFLA